MENDLAESKEKLHQSYQTISNLESKLNDVNQKLEVSNKKNDQLLRFSEKLKGNAEDLNRQV